MVNLTFAFDLGSHFAMSIVKSVEDNHAYGQLQAMRSDELTCVGPNVLFTMHLIPRTTTTYLRTAQFD